MMMSGKDFLKITELIN